MRPGLRGLPPILLAVLAPAACRAVPTKPSAESLGIADPGRHASTPDVGDEIVVAGERFHTGAPVVLWFETPRYSAYATEPRFESPADSKAADGLEPLRYQPGRSIEDPVLRASVAASGWTLENLQQAVHQFILHYDVCGTSRTCFRVLHDRRGLSVHFLLDVDGTIYQTLDLGDQAWHAARANPRSVGIEIAQIGAYPAGGPNPFDEWYVTKGSRTSLLIPERLGDGGVRTPNFEGLTRRAGVLEGELQGHRYAQFDFTNEQYESLIKLTSALVRVFPRIEPDAPRDASGAVRDAVLSDREVESFRGILGHYHVSESKVDPGPAFQWEFFLGAVRERLAATGGGNRP